MVSNIVSRYRPSLVCMYNSVYLYNYMIYHDIYFSHTSIFYLIF